MKAEVQRRWLSEQVPDRIEMKGEEDEGAKHAEKYQDAIRLARWPEVMRGNGNGGQSHEKERDHRREESKNPQVSESRLIQNEERTAAKSNKPGNTK